MGTLQGGSISFFPPTLTIKLCHAQLNHQDGATTARPHAARVTQTGSRSREQLGMFSLGAPRASSRGKQYKTLDKQLDKQQNQFARFHGPQRDKHGEMLVVTLPGDLPPATSISGVISSSFQFALLTSQRSCFPGPRQPLGCFTHSATNPGLFSF